MFVHIFFGLVLLSVEMHKRREKKLTGKNLNVDRQFLFFDGNLCNLIAGGWRQYQFLRKIATQSPYFHLLTHF